jgi:hypothetical protein
MATTPRTNLFSSNFTFQEAAEMIAPTETPPSHHFLNSAAHHNFEEIQTVELKKLEVQINTQKMYNQ